MKYLAILTGLALSACASMPSDVMIVADDHVSDCIAIGMVSNDAMHDLTLANATADMLNAAKARGADTVVIQNQSAKMLEVSIVGSAYHCGRAQR